MFTMPVFRTAASLLPRRTFKRQDTQPAVQVEDMTPIQTALWLEACSLDRLASNANFTPAERKAARRHYWATIERLNLLRPR